MPADMTVNGADIDAGRTADALKDGLKLRSENVGTPVVNDDEVKLLRAVRFTGRTGPVSAVI